MNSRDNNNFEEKMKKIQSEQRLGGAYFQILDYSNIIHIFGKSGSGKSTFVISLLKTIYTMRNLGKIRRMIYIDTENKFTNSRFSQIDYYQNSFVNHEDISNSFLVSKPRNLEEQLSNIEHIEKLIENNYFKINGIAIDSISHHFRVKLSKNYSERSVQIQYYFEEHVLPLLLYQKRTNCILVFVHQLTEKPDIGELPFLFDLFRNIDGSTWISMTSDKYSNGRMKVYSDLNIGTCEEIEYRIHNGGIQIE